MATGALIGALRVTLGLDSAAFEKGADKAQARVAGMSKGFATAGAKMAKVGTAMTLAFTAPFAALAKGSIAAASDAAELQSAFNQTFGAMAKDMTAWSVATGDALGRSTQEIEKGANAFGLYFNQAAKTRGEAAKLSQQFTVLAQDLSSFHNTSVDDALLALRSGLSGEAEPMRRFGVFLNDAAVKAEALAMGLKPVNGAFTDQQKIMARANIIMKATKDAQGDVIRTSAGMANQQRALNAAWSEMKVKLGTALLPLATQFVATMTKLLNAYEKLNPAQQNFAVGAGAVLVGIGPVMTAVGGLTSLMGLLVRGGAALAGMFGGMAAAEGVAAGGMSALATVAWPVTLAVAAVAAVAGAAYLAWKNWDTVGPVVADSMNQVVGALKATWDFLAQTFGPGIAAIVSGVSDAFSGLANGPLGELVARNIAMIGEGLKLLGQLAVPLLEQMGVQFQMLGTIIGKVIEAASPMFNSLAAVIGGAFRMIGDVINVVAALLMGHWGDALKYSKKLFVDFGNTISNAAQALSGGVTRWVAEMVVRIRTWMVDKLNAIWKWVLDGINNVKNAFFNLADAVVFHSYIPDMVDGIAAEIARLDGVMVRPIEAATAKSAKAFKALRDDVAGIMDDLFPNQKAARDLGTMAAKLEAGLKNGTITKDQFDEGMAEIRRRLAKIQDQAQTDDNDRRNANVDISTDDTINTDDLRDKTAEAAMAAIKGAAQHKKANDTIIASYAEMVRAVADKLHRLTDDIKNGDWLDVLADVADLIVQIVQGMNSANGSSGGTENIGTSIGTFFAGFRASGGPVGAGRAYMVGERGPEMFVPRTGGTVIANDRLKAANNNGVVEIHIVEGQMFEPRVAHISGGVAVKVVGSNNRVLGRAGRQQIP